MSGEFENLSGISRSAIHTLGSFTKYTLSPIYTIQAPCGFFEQPSWWSGDANEYKIACPRDNQLHVIEYTVGSKAR
ncbi:hypothetical protein OUZ56_016554 [Daphnia magna]|uniref:Uncharacterized protein n=1 Tax=Daphnia magna TaxID=35525 RepID=A0ABR0AR98_9CRUS|nr:hypothetical protein OUZ56_016554 [Daphnia magna]